MVVCFNGKREIFNLNIVKLLRESANEFKNVRNLCGISLLLALRVCLNFLTIPISDACHLSFLFIVMGIIGGMYGPFVGAVCGAVGDILCYIVHPMGGYFIGFTASAVIAGILYGLILYKNKFRVPRIIFAEMLVDVVVNVLLNTLWISMLYGTGFLELLITVRIPKNLIMIPLSIVIFILLSPLINKVATQNIKK